MIPNVTTEVISNADITVPSSLSSRIVREDNYVQLNITITEYYFHSLLTVILHSTVLLATLLPRLQAAPSLGHAPAVIMNRFKIPSNVFCPI